MEDSKFNPEENNSIESTPTNLNEDNKDLDEGNKKKENVKAFTEFLEKASNQVSLEEKVNLDSEQKLKIDKSLFKRFLNNGFDGISTNPNYKMLALLIILFINLSLFFVIGNIGKTFLRNSGIMG